MTNTKIVNCAEESYEIYIGRPSKWGNPFHIGPDGDRETVIKKYKNWILNNSGLLGDISELDGKVLGCWCKPHACHGDILVELLNNNKLLKW